MNNRFIMPAVAVVVALAGAATAGGQTREVRRITGAVTYVATGTFYWDAGRLKGVAADDTVMVTRKSKPVGVGVVTAVSSASAVARILSQSSPIAVGDSVKEVKDVVIEEPQSTFRSAQTARNAALMQDNRVSGRVGFQYAMAGVFGSTMDFAQPALVTQLSVNRLFGTTSTFTIYARTYRDMSPGFDRYGQGSRNKIRMFELSLTNNDPRSWYGYGVGRITSRYVGGLGIFDGAQLYVRQGNFTAGILGGTQPDYATSAFTTDETKFAAFLNYAWGGDVFKTSDITVAYGQQRFMGMIDRKFAYLQTSIRFGSDVSLYSSTELDFAHRDNGEQINKPTITNSFVTLSWTPDSWISINTGYDAVRALDLLQSMKAFPDTLMDKSIKEGYRANVAFRLPLRVTLSANGTFRLPSATTPSARTVGGTFRISDILDSDISMGAQFQNIQGVYTVGNDWTFDVDRWMAQSVSVSFRFDRYAYFLVGQAERIVTTTGSVSMNVSLLRSLYASVNYDQVWDTLRDTQRLYVEVGVRF